MDIQKCFFFTFTCHTGENSAVILPAFCLYEGIPRLIYRRLMNINVTMPHMVRVRCAVHKGTFSTTQLIPTEKGTGMGQG